MSANKSRSFCSILAISFSLAVFGSPISTAAVAQNNDGSLDSMFNENDAKKAESAGEKPVSKEAAAPAADAEETKNADGGDAGNAPPRRSGFPGVSRMRRRAAIGATPTPVEGFARSSLIQGTAWPGVGPFKAGQGTTLTDSTNETIKVEANEQKLVTGVEMHLKGHNAHDFLSIEMTADFLLESLNAKPARIADFNAAIEKARLQILGKSRAEAKINTAQFVVFVKPSEDLLDFTIRVDGPEPGQPVSLAAYLGAPPPVTTAKPVKPVTVDTTASNTTQVKPKPSIWDRIHPKPEEEKPVDMKTGIKELVDSWQSIKRKAVKNRDISELTTVLSGHALAVQTGGIKWLSEHHKFYEMVPKNFELGTITELAKDKKYSVMATIKEVSKLYDEQTNQLLRDSEDTYVVNYTVEKQDGKYFISDSSIVKIQTPQGTAIKK